MSYFSSNKLASKITAIRRNHRNLFEKGQAMLDYLFLLTIVIAILLLMGYYVRNSLSGKLRESADTFGRGEVYLPGDTEVTNFP